MNLYFFIIPAKENTKSLIFKNNCRNIKEELWLIQSEGSGYEWFQSFHSLNKKKKIFLEQDI